MTRKQFLPGMISLAACAALAGGASLPASFAAADGREAKPQHWKRKRGRKLKGHQRSR